MQRNTFHNIIFEDEQPFYPDQSFLARKSSLGNSMGFDIVTRQMQSLYEKIKDLQIKTEKINNQFSVRKHQTCKQQQLRSTSHYNNILETIEVKLQILLKQTQALMRKITTKFEKKIQQKVSQNSSINFEINIKQIQKQVSHIETQYACQLAKIKSKNKQIQEQTYKRLNDIEQQYSKKVIEFQRRQKDYIDKIQQLQSKIRNFYKNKKMIEVTQDKNWLYEQNKKDNIASYTLTYNVQQISELDRKNTFNANDSNSRIKRRKIFEKDQNRSISPCQQRSTVRTISPLHHNNFNNRNTVPVQPMHDTISHKIILPRSIKFAQKIKEDKNNVEYGQKQQVIFQITPRGSDFYRDIPPINWEGFEKFNEEQQQDAFFYPENKNFKKKTNEANQTENLFSPLDII